MSHPTGWVVYIGRLTVSLALRKGRCSILTRKTNGARVCMMIEFSGSPTPRSRLWKARMWMQAAYLKLSERDKIRLASARARMHI